MTAPTPLTVLIVEDRESDARLILSELCSAGFDPAWTRVETEAEYLAGLAMKPDLILFDCRLPHWDEHRGLQPRDESDADIPLIVVSARSGDETGVQTRQEGAAENKDTERLSRLGQAVTQALAQKKLRDAKRVADGALQE